MFWIASNPVLCNENINSQTFNGALMSATFSKESIFLKSIEDENRYIFMPVTLAVYTLVWLIPEFCMSLI